MRSGLGGDRQINDLGCGSSILRLAQIRKLLIGSAFRRWLAALDDFRNWLIREAA